MKKVSNTFRCRWGFSLAEMVASLVIGAMVLVAMLGIYNRAESSAAAIESRLDEARLPSEVLQRIAEDLDGIIALGFDTRVTIENKFKEGYQSAKLTITKNIFGGGRSLPKKFEEIIWQASYDYDSDANGLVLLRSHSGMTLEDKLLDERRADVEKAYPFVPICSGVTFFKVQVPKGEGFVNRWPGDLLPQGIMVTISFAEPYETSAGTWAVPDEEKITRTIAVDRTRKLKFIFVKAEYDDEESWDDDEESWDDDEESRDGDEESRDEDEEDKKEEDMKVEGTDRKDIGKERDREDKK